MNKEVSAGLTTLDKDGHRIFVQPLEVDGRYRKSRDWFYGFLVLFFLALPWIKIRGSQALLLDIANRRFAIFGLQFWAHDAPLLIFLFGGFAFAIFFVTALWGRVWCGWACPQTVFIDAVYRRIERWVEGKAPQRKALAKAPWNANKIGKFILKWFLYIVATLVVTHSFLAIFVGSEKLIEMMQRSPSESPASFIFIVATSALTLFNFAWFREQFCIIICPYGRVQSALLDEHSKIVAYDSNRSDCIDCNRCVNVCPTQIDIRHGLQMECIACTACIDACDDIMTKVKKPTGLIRYTTEFELKNAGGAQQTREADGKWSFGGKWDLAGKWNFSPRSILYMCILCIFVGGLTFLIFNREPVKLTLLRSEEIPTKVEDPLRLFHVAVEVSNQTFKPQTFKFYLHQESNTSATPELVLPTNPLVLEQGKTQKLELFVKMDRKYSEILYLVTENKEKNNLFPIYRPAAAQ